MVDTDTTFVDTQERFDVVIDNLIDFNLRYRQQFADSLMYRENPAEFLYSHCMVHANSGRGTGKTTYIIEHFNPLNDLVITFAEHHTSRIKTAIEKQLGKSVPSSCFISGHHFRNKDYFRGRPLGTITRVWFDEPAMIVRNTSLNYREPVISIWHMVQTLAPLIDTENGVIVLLGE
jgi:hypothetical protein